MIVPFSDRFQLVRKLDSVKQYVARAIADDSFHNRPEWAVRYGQRGRQACAADVSFHLEFLAGAIEAGSPEAFADYARWTVRVLGVRGIPAHALDDVFALLEKHLSPLLLPEDRETVLAFLAKGREGCAEPGPPPGAASPGDELRLTTEVFLAAILNGQRQAAINIVEEALRAGRSHVDLYTDVFTESLHRIGALWETNKISVAQEHVATAITQYAIAAIYPRMVPARVRRGNMVITGVSGELHQIGANLVADAMEANGWTVRFLGTNVPHSAILDIVDESAADVLCVSTTIIANLPSVAELVRTVRDKLSARSPNIVLGGAAYGLAKQFAGEVGAMGAFTDLRPALALLCT